jgi:N-acetyl-anhydromuramyl-L-alanine amidase AmpD
MNVTWIGAHKNNFGVGRGGKKVRKIVLHWIVGSLKSADATFAKSTRKASAHYGIGNKEIHQWVKEEDTAWHASNLAVNTESIGIEHEGGPNLPITEETIQTSIALVVDICRRHSITPSASTIKRHSDISATQCPGTLPVERIIEEASKILSFPVIKPTDEFKWFRDFMAEKNVPQKDWEPKVRAWYDAARSVVAYQEIAQKDAEIIHDLQEENQTLKDGLQQAKDAIADLEEALEVAIPQPPTPEQPQSTNWLNRLIAKLFERR